MKLISLIKIFGVTVVAGGITAACAFANFNNVDTPYVKVLTKNNYLDVKKSQTAAGVANVNINYAALPTANKNLVNVLTTDNLPSNAFMLTLGSYAYGTTKKMLNGSDTITSPDLENTDSLMLDLYDEFFNDRWNSLNMQFYSYIDVVDTTTYYQAAQVLHERKQIGDVARADPNNFLSSTRWNVLNENGNLDIGERNLVPVVLNGDTYNYAPDTTTYYEWRPDNKYDTEYEKVYFRNDDATRTFIDSTTWASTYATNVLDTTISKEGTLLCGKYDTDTNTWSYLAFTSLNDFATDNTTTLKKIQDFYNPEDEA